MLFSCLFCEMLAFFDFFVIIFICFLFGILFGNIIFSSLIIQKVTVSNNLKQQTKSYILLRVNSRCTDQADRQCKNNNSLMRGSSIRFCLSCHPTISDLE
jgi:hypothetical protein